MRLDHRVHHRVATSVYRGSDVPKPADGHVRLNLRVFDGTPRSDGQQVEIVVESFVNLA